MAWLRETGRRYIIGAPKSDLKKCREQLAEPKGWHALRDGVEVKLFDGEEPGERFVLCRSADRRSKERAMHEKFSQRIETALERLQSRICALQEAVGPRTDQSANRPTAATQLTRRRSV